MQDPEDGQVIPSGSTYGGAFAQSTSIDSMNRDSTHSSRGSAARAGGGAGGRAVGGGRYRDGDEGVDEENDEKDSSAPPSSHFATLASLFLGTDSPVSPATPDASTSPAVAVSAGGVGASSRGDNGSGTQHQSGADTSAGGAGVGGGSVTSSVRPQSQVSGPAVRLAGTVSAAGAASMSMGRRRSNSNAILDYSLSSEAPSPYNDDDSVGGSGGGVGEGAARNGQPRLGFQLGTYVRKFGEKARTLLKGAVDKKDDVEDGDGGGSRGRGRRMRRLSSVEDGQHAWSEQIITAMQPIVSTKSSEDILLLDDLFVCLLICLFVFVVHISSCLVFIATHNK